MIGKRVHNGKNLDPKSKRSKGWRHALKVSTSQTTAKTRSRSPGAPERITRKPPSMPSLPWKKED